MMLWSQSRILGGFSDDVIFVGEIPFLSPLLSAKPLMKEDDGFVDSQRHWEFG